MQRLGVTRECADLIVSEEGDADWAQIVKGDPTKHAYEVDERGVAI